MNVAGWYVFNDTLNRWLQDDGTWGWFSTARTFETCQQAEHERELLEANAKMPLVTYTMGWAQ